MTNKSEDAVNPSNKKTHVLKRDDYYYSKKRVKRPPEPRRGMQLSNPQLKLLLPVIKRELLNDPQNIEWRDLYDRLVKQVGFRMSKPGGESLVELLKDDFAPPPLKVWGKD